MRRSMSRLFSIVVLLFCLMVGALQAQQLQGRVMDADGKPLPYASVYIKGSTRGTTANADGKYTLALAAGKYTVVCAFVGYTKREALVEIKSEGQTLDFELTVLQTQLSNVVVKVGAEDPAYAIIRKAIKNRKTHLAELKQWQVMVYMKGMIRTISMPKSIFGIKMDPNRDVVDSSGKGIIYFSESLTRYSRQLPNKYKEEVISAKLSGSSQGFGFNSPKDLEVNLYENNIALQGLSSRGFMSPISENALYFYKYKYEGTFYEDGLEISRIKVMPRRKYEPCFSGGYITIIEGSFRIHSAQLYLTKESQLQLVDSLELRQQMLPVGKGLWAPQQNHIVASFNVFGIRAVANFEAQYSDYDLDKPLDAVFKGNVVKVIDTAANKKTLAYWDSIRPMPLTAEEQMDYLRKDTLERKFKDPKYTDSLNKRSNKITAMKVLVRGGSVERTKKRMVYSYPGLLQSVQYNTVEGWVANFAPQIRRWGDTGSFRIEPVLRYGFGNKRLNAALTVAKNFGQNYRKRWGLSVSGGRMVMQINPSAPIEPLVNSIATLLYKRNFMKIYENTFVKASAGRTLLNGLRLNGTIKYEDRRPLDNTDTTYTWVKWNSRRFTSNYPEELPAGNFIRHQALITSATLTWQPGAKFMDYPNRRYNIGSDAPVFSLNLVKAWKNVLGSDANFSKWRVSMSDDFNMKLGGVVAYNAAVGGFINNSGVQLPDWQHFNGNQTLAASPYVNSYQLAPYYANSTKDRFFATGHLEWHLNGLLTNKIPLIRRWNWGLVTGSNAFFVDADRHYIEGFVGIENIFKSLRIDWVTGYDAQTNRTRSRIVIGLSGLFTGQGVQ
ncbi:MAG: carboxypeptidase-like regulatory domain-containing protein [Bacteroidetes bacterium]|nr:MAG: carboxypeptidase-like regulatory domain-containing protein [Bacteroidota bacterium]